MENDNRIPHMKDEKVKYTKGYAKKLFMSKALRLLLVLTSIALVGGASYIYVKQPVKTADGYLTSKVSYDIPEHGEEMVIVEGDSYNFLTPAKRFFFKQDAYKAKVIAGPYGEFQKSKKGYSVSDGKSVIAVNLKKAPEYLDMQYVVRKVDDNGKFLKGQKDILVEKDELLGKTKKESKIDKKD